MLAVLLPLALALSATAFTFRTTAPSQCGEMTVQWDGGEAPFYMVIVPTTTKTAGRIMNISLPATGSPPYSHTFQLPEPAGLGFVATMGDATGFGAGGASQVLTVGDSSDLSCLNSTVLADFYFWTEPVSNPRQCGNMAITWNGNAVSPLGVHGIVVGGSAWDIPVPSNAVAKRTMDWMVNVAAGTKFLILMSDVGPYGTGGSTTILTVGEGGSDACLDENSPHSTSVPPLLTLPTSTPIASGDMSRTTSPGSMTALAPPSSGLQTPSQSHQSASPEPSSSLHPTSGVPVSPPASNTSNGAVIGAAVGITLAVLLALLLALCLICRRRKKAAENPKAKFGTPPSISAPVMAEEGGSGTRQMLRRLTTTGGRSGHIRVSSRGFSATQRPGSLAFGPIAGLPNGAAPPSVFTNDSHSEVFQVDPFPYEHDLPPEFSTLGINSSLSDVKSPSATATPTDSRFDNPFLDTPPSPGSKSTLLSPVDDKSEYNPDDTPSLSYYMSEDIPEPPPYVYRNLRAINPDPAHPFQDTHHGSQV